MRHRRALLALSILLASLPFTGSGAVVASAQSDVDEAEQRARQAEQEVDEAYRIVSGAVENRDEIENELFEALQRYESASIALEEANRDLERIRQSLVFAETSAQEVDRSLHVQAVAAYMEAISAVPTVVFDTTSIEDAIIVGHAFEAGQEDTLAQLDELLIRRQELESLRTRFREERDRVQALTDQLASESAHLEELFTQANQQVAEAFARAQSAESEYQVAVDEVERARADAAEAERRRQEEERRREATSGEPVSDDSNPGITITARTKSWLPLVQQHFAADLVDEALVIMECESGGDPNAVNPYSGASGLYQFLSGTWAVASVRAGVDDRSVFDGEANIIAASWLAEYYRSRGYDPWTPWSCRVYL